MEERTIESLPLDGGKLCLNFVNTVHDRTVEEPFEYLSSYNDLLEWSVKLEILSSPEREKLTSLADDDPEKSSAALRQVLEAREVLYNLFLAIAQNRVPNDETQGKFNKLLSEATSGLALQIKGEDLNVQHKWLEKDNFRYLSYPILKSAYDLLVSDDLDRVKECGACGWLFYDQSKNKSRKWCSMENCGSNVKAKRYYHRHKKKKED
ncbi:CGNR zinc finger domain-containing protein [Fodinibius salsisoli]|uniref:CGNR zinc finger domain-containing protein n=1 Tax=Fodinibius salsisoli TaxID=2820877 RepID=A0ABT3PIM9_9BACT|nr:CGNR zinc finger domain-containing protein [Fodinibius salsisoli]MCW9705643.1 CGNR zinc finger domain-containing protein [Fodinibius salsisoli]